MWSKIRARIARHSVERQIVDELSILSDRALEDIGIRRVDIRRFARRAAAGN